ncbi:MAG: helix-turn-helix domain-containing protein, partial [Rhodospirillales bacterium]|nr:helix-turn-helix domain-containing protein [Rhodospirillales bacterium]
MRLGIGLRSDFSVIKSVCLARQSDDADQTRRLLSIAVILDGGSRSDAVRTGGVGLQVIRARVLRFNAGGPEGFRTRKAPGKPSILTDEQRQQLAAVVEADPDRDGVVRWRLVDLAVWVKRTFGVTISRTTVGRELRAMGFRKLSARPQHH